MSGPTAIVFDFDGVIVESGDLKTSAMAELFKDEPARLDEIVALHLRHGGISRLVKFDMIYRDVLKRPLPAAERERLGRRFGELVEEQVVACRPVPGALEFLGRHRGRTPMFLISGTPGRELDRIVERRGFRRFFDEVHGSPPGKPETVRDILARHGWNAADLVFVGDAPSDEEAAQVTGLAFVGRVPPGRRSPFAQDAVTVPDLAGLDAATAQALDRHRGRGKA